MKLTQINGRWPLLLPEHRADRREWPWWEATRLAAMASFIGPGDVVFDLGAEEGDFPAIWASWGASVVAVEPNPRVWPNIRAIWEANKLPPLLGWWVGFMSDSIDEAPPICDIDATDVDGWPACAYGPVIGDHGHRHLAEETDTTPSITLDELVKRVGVAPTVITLDCEGSEGPILRGAWQTLVDARPLVFCSVHPEFMKDMYGETPEQLYAYMADVDYERVFLTHDHEVHDLFVPVERMWPR